MSALGILPHLLGCTIYLCSVGSVLLVSDVDRQCEGHQVAGQAKMQVLRFLCMYLYGVNYG